MKKVLLLIIRLYQKTLSPDHSWLRALSGFYRCRYFPSCSEYSHRAIEHYGIGRGLWLSIRRLIRCFLTKGGYDPLR